MCCGPHLEQGAVALQSGWTERGHGTEAAPEVDPREERTVGQEEAGGRLQEDRGVNETHRPELMLM